MKKDNTTVTYERLKRSNTSRVEDDDEGGGEVAKHNKGKSNNKSKGVSRRSSRELSDSSSDDIPSNEARRAGFKALKKRGVEIRQSLSKKLLADPSRFEKLVRKWRDADEDGYGLIDKESFVDVLFIQLRSKSRPTPEETEWLCHQLKTKNKLIAYREARNVISGDYFDGSSYMPMWATAKMPYVPSPYMPMGMMTMTGPYDPSCMTYTNSTLSSTMLGGGGGAAYTRRMSMDEYNRAVPHADVLRQSSSGRRPSQDYDRRPNASSAKTIKAPALALPLKDKVRSRSHHHRRPLHDDDEDEVDAYERRKGRGSSSARTWPDSDTDSDGSEAWAAMPGTVGEWLRYVASPLERRNFEELLTTLEDFAFDRGIQQRDGSHAPDGVLIRLGSMLHAKLTFHITS